MKKYTLKEMAEIALDYGSLRFAEGAESGYILGLNKSSPKIISNLKKFGIGLYATTPKKIQNEIKKLEEMRNGELEDKKSKKIKKLEKIV